MKSTCHAPRPLCRGSLTTSTSSLVSCQKSIHFNQPNGEVTQRYKLTTKIRLEPHGASSSSSSSSVRRLPSTDEEQIHKHHLSQQQRSAPTCSILCLSYPRTHNSIHHRANTTPRPFSALKKVLRVCVRRKPVLVSSTREIAPDPHL